MFTIKWAPVLSAGQLAAAANPQSSNQPEALPWMLYDTISYVSGTTVSQTFFQSVQADKTLGNMESAGQLPDPQYFVMHYLTCDILQVPTIDAAADQVGALNNIDLLLKAARATFTFQMSNKFYGPFPLTLCHSTGGATGNGWGTNAAPNNIQFGNNGIPGSGGFPVLGAQVIPPKVGFSIIINYAAAQTLAGGTAVNIRFGMAGVLYRRVL